MYIVVHILQIKSWKALALRWGRTRSSLNVLLVINFHSEIISNTGD